MGVTPLLTNSQNRLYGAYFSINTSMDINELESFKLSDAVKFHNKLNPVLWTDKEKLDTEVRDQLLLIAEDFITHLGIKHLDVEDVTVSGSNAAYSYTPHSDLDLHILVDFDKLGMSDVYSELFAAKKNEYNENFDITVRGVPVELYVQDSKQPHVSLGEYSVVNDKWLKFPKKQKANFDQMSTKSKYEKLGEMIEAALKSKDYDKVVKVLDIIKRYRKAGLEKGGEFGPENLAFKAIRKQGLIQKLYDLKNSLHSKELSIENVTEILDKESAAKVYWSKENYMTDAPVSQMYTTYTAAAQDKNKNILKYNFYNFPKHDLTAIEFSRAVGPWGDNFSIDNAGDQYTVFATLIKTIEEYLSKHKSKFLMFGAKEPSRAKLYQSFIDRFANKFGYKQINPDSIPKPVSSMILNSGDTPFLLQKVGSVKEASGYIPSKKEKNDPRFKTALTVDVKPDSIKKNAKAFGWKVSRTGIPPLLRK